MKKRRFVLLTFLVCAVLVISVGFANLIDSLSVDGTSTTSKEQATQVFDTDVYFTGAEALTNGNTASVNADNNDKVSFTANTLVSAGDKAEFRFEVSNFSALDATLTTTLTANATTITNDDGQVTTLKDEESYFKVTYQWDTTTVVCASATNIPGKAYLTVTVELLESPEFNTKGDFTLTISVVSKGDLSTPSNDA